MSARGESTLRDSMGYGNGVYKSTDAGKTWTHLGLDDTQHIGKIAIDPKNPNIVFVAAIGHLYAPSPDRGVFRSRDGGKTWQKVLFKNDDVGAVDVVIDPTNSNVVYAGLWNTRRPPWYTYRPSNGPGGGIFKSTDGGTTWKQLTNGLPKEGIGRTGIAVVAEQSAARLCGGRLSRAGSAAPPPAAGGWRWRRWRRWRRRRPGAGRVLPLRRRRRDVDASVVRHRAVGTRLVLREGRRRSEGRGHRLRAERRRESRPKDGGKTWVALRGSPGGDDYHQAWVSPDDSNTMIVASDQGAIITRNAKTDDPTQVTWSSWLNQPTAQIYHVSVDYRFPYWVTGAQQDSGAVAVRSRGKFAEISMRDWEPIGAGGESGMTAGDPLHPGIIYRRNRPALRSRDERADARHDGAASRRSRRGPTGRSRSCSRRPIRARCTTRISSCSRRRTARERGRRSVPISRGRIPACRRRSTRRRRRTYRSQRQARRRSTPSRRRRCSCRWSGSAPTTA